MEKIAVKSDTNATTNEKIPDGNTFLIKPTLENTFQTFQVKEIIKECLTSILTDKIYSKEEVPVWTKQIADDVSNKIVDLKMKRYKHVVTVTLGQQLGAGCKYISRCRWDAECDSQVSDVFTNSSLFCVVTVFGVYLY
ncbi:dynein light chain Tctex-type protein 2B [Lutzomyia longipalpis]|uniref:dynein light chain Tctex-type protein 2B n=1 Tax=Lutzomyia longipalpis TaxID=7200 RepID=UPI002483ABAE|nr:dynein light chain Tctex-type protein 2B [Lutzomyia longipalpis]